MKQIFISALLLLSAFSFGIDAQSAGRQTEPVKLGEIAPNFKLRDVNGKSITLSSLKQTTVLVFYRGYW